MYFYDRGAAESNQWTLYMRGGWMQKPVKYRTRKVLL